jgi:DNA repair protein RecO (recombination protein O)
MLYKTRGIALNYVRFRETSIIAKIYTEEFGVQSYIVNGVRSAKAKTNRIAFFQPLTLLDLVVYHKQKEEAINRISEIKPSVAFQSLPFEIAKSSMALFITEMLTKTLREEEANAPLYQFITDSVLYLEHATQRFENFHLMFLAKLSAYLGFGAETAREFEAQLLENRYGYPLDDQTRTALQSFLFAPYEHTTHLDRTHRNQLLDALVFFYKIHLEGLGEIKSLDVLRETMS